MKNRSWEAPGGDLGTPWGPRGHQEATKEASNIEEVVLWGYHVEAIFWDIVFEIAF